MFRTSNYKIFVVRQEVNMITKKEISKKIINMMKLTGLNQSQLADLLGTSRKNVSKWKHQTHYPNEKSIEAINKLYEQVTKEYGEIKE